MRTAHLVALTALATSLSLMGCMAPVDPATPQEDEASEETGTSSQELECMGQCQDEVIQCEYDCEQQFHPYWDEGYYNSCMNRCWQDYSMCPRRRYVLAGPSYQICHIDPDVHFSGVDVEFHTVDVYVDPTCASSPVYYRKRVLDSVHCGWHSESTCENRVETRLTQTWIPRGYYPTVTEADGDSDLCPRPRL